MNFVRFNSGELNLTEYDGVLAAQCEPFKGRLEATDEKVKILFESFLKSKIKVEHAVDSAEYQYVHHLIVEIIRYEPGMMLIKKLIETEGDLFVKVNSFYNQYVFEESCVYVNNKIDSYIVVRDQGDVLGRQRLYMESPALVLAHELIHALHDLEQKARNKAFSLAESVPELVGENDPFLEIDDGVLFDDAAFFAAMTDQGVLLEKMDDFREQKTILGVEKILGEFMFDPVCENTFHMIDGACYRMNHRGVEKLCGDPLNPLDVITGLEDIACLQSMLERDTSQLNKCYVDDYGSRLSLLTAAILSKCDDIVEYLLDQKELFIFNPDDEYTDPTSGLVGSVGAALFMNNEPLYGRLLKISEERVREREWDNLLENVLSPFDFAVPENSPVRVFSPSTKRRRIDVSG